MISEVHGSNTITQVASVSKKEDSDGRYIEIVTVVTEKITVPAYRQKILSRDVRYGLNRARLAPNTTNLTPLILKHALS